MRPTAVHHLLINTSCQVQQLPLVNMLQAAVTGPLRGACRLISSREGGGTGAGQRGRMFFVGVLAGGERCWMLLENSRGPAEDSVQRVVGFPFP